MSACKASYDNISLMTRYLTKQLSNLSVEEISEEAKFIGCTCESPNIKCIVDTYCASMREIINDDMQAIMQVEYLLHLKRNYSDFLDDDDDEELMESMLVLLGTTVLDIYKKHKETCKYVNF